MPTSSTRLTLHPPTIVAALVASRENPTVEIVFTPEDQIPVALVSCAIILRRVVSIPSLELVYISTLSTDWKGDYRMPRGKRSGGGSALEQVKRQARALLVTLNAEIRNKEIELKQLKDEAVTLGRLSGSPQTAARPTVRAAAASAPASARRGKRINWNAILQQLPKQFKAADIRQVNIVKGKRPSELFAAITRWIEAGLVKRKTRGVYERA
jgi:hypothetical protein